MQSGQEVVAIRLYVPETADEVRQKASLLRDYYFDGKVFRPSWMIYSSEAFDEILPKDYLGGLMEAARNDKMEIIELRNMPFIHSGEFKKVREQKKIKFPLGFASNGWLGRHGFSDLEVLNFTDPDEIFDGSQD